MLFVCLAAAIAVSPLHTLSEEAIDQYAAQSAARSSRYELRLIETVESTLGTPYADGPLGEGPEGRYDKDPLIDFSRVDCVTFVEQSIALASASSYQEAFDTLQAIRYRGGVRDFEHRNHFLIADWIPANSFCRNVTASLGVETETVIRTISRRGFFERVGAKGLGENIPDEKVTLAYVRATSAAAAEARLPSPALVVLIGRVDWLFALHCGIFIRDEGGQGLLVHASSKEGRVVETGFAEYLASSDRYLGFTAYTVNDPSPPLVEPPVEMIPIDAAALPPAPPKTDYPALEPATPAASSAAAWIPMAGSEPATTVTIEGSEVLRMPCNFAGTNHERVSWDLPVDQDLSRCQCLCFSLYCPEASPIGDFTFYMRSGEGWYSAKFSLADPSGWNRIRLDPAEFRFESRPEGWGSIDQVRLSAWRASDENTVFYVADLGWVEAEAGVVLIRGEASARLSSEKAAGVQKYTWNVARCLRELGIPAGMRTDATLDAKALAGVKVAILPYNPDLPDSAVAALGTFIDHGGKLLSLYLLPPALAQRVGVERGRHLRADRPGRFASIRPAEVTIEGLPAMTMQNSWNILQALPVPGESFVAAEWYSNDGVPGGDAAVIASDKGVHMTHILETEDMPNKERLVLAMLGHLMPEAFAVAARCRIDRAGMLEGFSTAAEAREAMRSMAGANPAVTEPFTEAEEAHAWAEELLAQKRYPEAMEAAAAAHKATVTAYCAAQSPQPDEFRGFWCHNPAGVLGMGWETAIERLAEAGFTAVFPNMLWGGSAAYPSEVLPWPRISRKAMIS